MGEAITEQELHQIHSIINDIWQYIKQHSDIQDTDEYWDSLITDSNIIWEKHDRHDLCQDLIYATAKWFDKRARANEQVRTGQ